jgi:hypothetical protein
MECVSHIRTAAWHGEGILDGTLCGDAVLGALKNYSCFVQFYFASVLRCSDGGC